MVVLRMKIADVADRWRVSHGETVGLGAHPVFIADRPAIGAGDHAHPVRAQNVKLHRQTVGADSLDIGVAGQHQLAEQRLQQIGPSLGGVRSRQQCQHRVNLIAPGVVLQHQRHRAAASAISLTVRNPIGLPAKPLRVSVAVSRAPGIGRPLPWIATTAPVAETLVSAGRSGALGGGGTGRADTAARRRNR